MKEFIEVNLIQLTPILFYLTLFVVVYLETAVLIAFFIPGDTLLFTAGLIVGANSNLNIFLTSSIISIAAFLGDQTAFHLGKRFGYEYITKRKSATLDRITERAEIFYKRHGVSSMFLARFYPWFRTLIPFIAGISRMGRSKFLCINLISASAWGFGITYLGYLANSLPELRNSSRYIAAFFVILTMMLIIKNLINQNREQVALTNQ